MISFLLLAFVAFLDLAANQFTNPADAPNFSTLRDCAQFPFTCGCGDGVIDAVGCDNWQCVCDDYSAAALTLSSIVSSLCSGRIQDISGASSVLNDLCNEITVSPSVFGPTPVQTETGIQVLTNPTDISGFGTLQDCVQFAFTCGCDDAVMGAVGCENWECVCSDYSNAILTLSSQVSSGCSGNVQDISAAASILDELCYEITLTTSIPGPTAETGPVVGAGMAGATPTCNNSYCSRANLK
jgi:hypothetical protein